MTSLSAGSWGRSRHSTGLDVSGADLTLPLVLTDPITAQTYTALDTITLTQSRTVNGAIAFTADADNDGTGTFILLDGVSLTASNNTLSIIAADLDLQGGSSLSSGSGVMTITASAGGSIGVGNTAGQMTISGDELQRISTSNELQLVTTGTGGIIVDGVTQAQSSNVAGLLTLDAQGTGNVSFATASSVFNALSVRAGGNIELGQDLSTTNDTVTFETSVVISGASEVTTDGGDIVFLSTVAVSDTLVLTTGGGGCVLRGSAHQ